MNKVCEQIEEQIELITNDGVSENNVCYLGQLVDIHKDLANEEYWETKEDNMRYGTYSRDSYRGMDDSYGRRRRDSRGRYMGRGDEMIDEMHEHYGNYHEGKREYNRGNYGAKEDTMKSLEYMLQSVEDFMMMLAEDANSQEEVDMIRHTAKRISEM